MNATQYLARQAAPQDVTPPTPPPTRRQQRQRPVVAQVVRELLQKHDDLSPAARLVAMTIASYADGEGWAHPRVSTIVKATHLSQGTVCRAVAQLQELGILDKELQEAGPVRGHRATPIIKEVCGAGLGKER